MTKIHLLIKKKYTMTKIRYIIVGKKEYLYLQGLCYLENIYIYYFVFFTFIAFVVVIGVLLQVSILNCLKHRGETCIQGVRDLGEE